MKIWLELFINLIESTIIVDFLTRYFGLKKKDWKSYIVVISTEVVLFSVITFFTWNQSFETLSTLIIGVLSFAFCAFCLNGHILEKAFISAFVMALIAVIATVTTLVFGSVFKCDVTKILEFYSPARAIALVTTKVIFFWITRAILKIKLRTELHIQDGLLLVIVPLCSIGAISLLMPAALSDTEIQEYVLGAVITIAIMDFLIYYLFLRIASVNQIKQEYALLELQYSCSQKNALDIKRLYDEVCAVRHDLKNHMLCIDRMAMDHKCNEIRCYIKKLFHDAGYNERTILFTGNNILDAILNAKISVAEQNGVRCQATITSTNIPLSENDICVLFGNLMDNAIEAAADTVKKRIDIKIAEQGKYLLVRIQNSIQRSVLKTNPSMTTTKNDKKMHGIGVNNIKRIVEEYGGIIEYFEENDRFSCDILIPTIPSTN